MTAGNIPSLPGVRFPQNWRGTFDVRGFSLTDEWRDGMGERLDHFLKTRSQTMGSIAPDMIPDTHPATKELAEIAVAYLPGQFIEESRLSARGQLQSPIVVYNLPEVEVDTGRIDEQPFYAPFITRALCATYDMGYASHQRLNRKGGSRPGEVIRGGYIHTDPYDWSAMSAPLNTQEAPTRIVDFRAVLNGVSDEVLEEIICHPLSVKHPPTTLLSLKKESDSKGRAFPIDRECSDPVALAILDDAVRDHSVDVTLQKGMMVFFGNSGLYHYGCKGLVSGIPSDQLSRVLEYSGANLRL